MPVLSVCWRRPSYRIAYRLRVVVIIVVYLSAFHLVPRASVALAAGSLLGLLLGGEPSGLPQTPRIRKSAR
jgi:hypothetical protein